MAKTTRWPVRKRASHLLDIGRAIYGMHNRCNADSWYSIAKRAELSGNCVQRFLAIGDIQRPQNGRAIANIEAIFEAMGHQLIPVPLALQATIQKIIDTHYAKYAP